MKSSSHRVFGVAHEFWYGCSSLVLSCNSWSFVIDLNYGYQYLLELYSKLSDIYFVIWLHYHSMLALCYRPVLAMVNILALEL